MVEVELRLLYGRKREWMDGEVVLSVFIAGVAGVASPLAL